MLSLYLLCQDGIVEDYVSQRYPFSSWSCCLSCTQKWFTYKALYGSRLFSDGPIYYLIVKESTFGVSTTLLYLVPLMLACTMKKNDRKKTIIVFVSIHSFYCSHNVIGLAR
jgi:hypothetical protein